MRAIHSLLHKKNFIAILRQTEILLKLRKQLREMFFKKDVLKNFANFTGKHMCLGSIFNNVSGHRVPSVVASETKKNLGLRLYHA